MVKRNTKYKTSKSPFLYLHPCGLTKTKYKIEAFFDSFCTLCYLVPCRASKYKKCTFLILSSPRILWCHVANYKSEMSSSNWAVTHILNMKRGAALSNVAASKKQKKIASSQPYSQSSKSLRPSPAVMATVSKSKAAPLNHKQLKAIQNLISGASYFSVLESNTMAEVKIRERCYMYYHGYDDHPGFLRLFLAGNGRFRVLWDDDRIISGLGYVSGISKATCKAILGYSTLS